MAIKTFYVCDDCERIITPSQSGFVIKGNIYTVNNRGGIIGNNFPEKVSFSEDEIKEVTLCYVCLLRYLDKHKDI